MHTNATVTLSDNNQSAKLELGGETLIATLRSPSGASFTTQEPAQRLPSDPTTTFNQGREWTMSPDQPNPGVTVLMIDLDAGNQVIEVLFNVRSLRSHASFAVKLTPFPVICSRNGRAGPRPATSRRRVWRSTRGRSRRTSNAPLFPFSSPLDETTPPLPPITSRPPALLHSFYYLIRLLFSGSSLLSSYVDSFLVYSGLWRVFLPLLLPVCVSPPSFLPSLPAWTLCLVRIDGICAERIYPRLADEGLGFLGARQLDALKRSVGLSLYYAFACVESGLSSHAAGYGPQPGKEFSASPLIRRIASSLNPARNPPLPSTSPRPLYAPPLGVMPAAARTASRRDRQEQEAKTRSRAGCLTCQSHCSFK